MHNRSLLSPIKLFFICSLLILVSCSGGNNSGTPECGANASCARPQDGNGQFTLTGRWELACYLDTDNPREHEAIYRNVVITFAQESGSTFITNFASYRSQTCTDTAIADESGTLTGIYTTGADFTSDEGLLVTELDLMRNSITYLNGQSISPVTDRPLILTVSYFDDESLYLGLNDISNLEIPTRVTSVDFDRPFTKQ